MRWGLIPSFTESNQSLKEANRSVFKMTNARSETVSSSPVFRRLLDRKRCVVPMDGFFEWHTENSIKQPYFIYMKKLVDVSSLSALRQEIYCENNENDLRTDDGETGGERTGATNSHASGVKRESGDETTPGLPWPDTHKTPTTTSSHAGTNAGTKKAQVSPPHLMYLAAVHDVWYSDVEQKNIHTFAILTTASFQEIGWLHHRMPGTHHCTSFSSTLAHSALASMTLGRSYSYSYSLRRYQFHLLVFFSPARLLVEPVWQRLST